MKEETSALTKDHEALKQAINAGMEKIFPAFLFNAMGRGLVKIFHLKNPPHWTVSATVLFLLVVFSPGLLIAILTKEIWQWQGFHLFFYLGMIPFGYLSSIVCYLNVTYNLLPGIRDDIVKSIMTTEDLEGLGKWLNELWSIRKSLLFSFILGSLVAALFITILSFANGGFIGIGLSWLSFSTGPFYVGPLYIVYRTVTLLPLLTKFQLRLYEPDPVNSEVIQRLIYIMNVYLYWVAGYVAAGTAFSALNSVTAHLVWLFIFIGWAPTIVQFLVDQYAIRKIIISTKWRRLNRLQEQIQALQDGNLKDVDDKTIARINQLMDLHDRISSRPNSILSWGTGLSFLNQLMLPLLGLLLGNIDKILGLINVKTTP